MKRKLFKTLIAAGAVAMICACGDETASNNVTLPSGYEPGTGVADNPNPSGGVTNPGNNAGNPQDSTSSVGGIQDPTDPTNPGQATDPTNPQNPTSSAGDNPTDPQNPGEIGRAHV